MRVLVADDHPPILAQMAKLLKEAGCTIVAQFENGNAAQIWLEDHEDEIDAMFLDIQMPGLSGIELSAFHPNVPVVFVTGYEGYAVKAFDLAACGYLLKPVDAEQVSLALAKLRHRIAAINASTILCRDADGRRIYAPLHSICSIDLIDQKPIAKICAGEYRVIGYRTLAEIMERYPDNFFRACKNRLLPTNSQSAVRSAYSETSVQR